MMNLSGLNFHGHSVNDPVNRFKEVGIDGSEALSPGDILNSTVVKDMITAAGNGLNGAPSVMSSKLNNQVEAGILPDQIVSIGGTLMDYVKKYGFIAGSILILYFLLRR